MAALLSPQSSPFSSNTSSDSSRQRPTLKRRAGKSRDSNASSSDYDSSEYEGPYQDREASFSSLSISSSPSIASVRTAKIVALSALRRVKVVPPLLPNKDDALYEDFIASEEAVKAEGGRKESSELDIFIESLEEQETELKADERPGPKMKIFSPAPWHLERDEDFISFSSSSSGGRRSDGRHSESPGATFSTRSLASASTSQISVVSDNPRSSKELGPSAPSASTQKRSRISDALRGLGIGLDSRSRSSSPRDSTQSEEFSLAGGFSNAPGTLSRDLGDVQSSRAIKGRPRASAIPFPTNLDQSSLSSPSFPPMPHSAPANMTTFPSTVPDQRDASATVEIQPLRIRESSVAESISSLQSFSPHPRSSTSSNGAKTSPVLGHGGHKLISLTEARQRELDRVVQAAARKQAMLSVEHVAGRDAVSYGASSPSLRTVKEKPKLGGFLRRMIPGHTSGVSPPTTPVIPKEQDRNETQTLSPPASPSLSITPPLPPPIPSPSSKPTTIREDFFDDGVQRLQAGIKLAPSLTLRPMSTNFASKLPEKFLHNVKEEPSSPRLPPSPLSASSSWSFFDDRRSPSSGSTATTPLSATFSSRGSSKITSPGASIPETTTEILLQFSEEKQEWEIQQRAMESEIRTLRAELDKFKYGEFQCDACGCTSRHLSTPSPNSTPILSRPRPLLRSDP